MKRKIRQAAAFLLAVSLFLTSCSSSMVATTMELSKTEGTVNIFDGKQKEIEPVEQLGLYSGYQVETQQVSYAWINLDKVKLTKMDAESEIEIKKKKNDLEIMVNSGKLFFHITEPLEDDETLNIRTSSMIVGIRGTCGWVEAYEQEEMRVYVLEGTIACRKDKPDGEELAALEKSLPEELSLQNILRQFLIRMLPSTEKEDHSENDQELIYVSGGEMAELTYSPDGEERITVSKFEVSDIPVYVMEELLEDDELKQKILEESGLDIENGTSGDNPERNPNEMEQDGYPQDEETGEVNFFLRNTRYYGDPDACTLTRSQAELFIREIQSAISIAADQYQQNLHALPPGSDAPFRSYAALFDAGNGCPAVFFSSGAYTGTNTSNPSNPEVEQVIWVPVLYQAVFYLEKPDEVYHTGLEKLFLGDGYLFGGGYRGDGSGYDGYVYPLIDGRMNGARSMASADFVADVCQVDGNTVSRAEFDQWVKRWDVPSEVGYTHANDVSGECWGMVPAEEVIAALNAYVSEG